MTENTVPGILLALLSSMLVALMFYSLKLALKHTTNSNLFGGLYQFGAAFFFLIWCFISPVKVDLDPGTIALLLLSAGLYSTFSIANINASKILDVSITGILSQLTLIFSFLGSIVFFQEANNLFGKIIGVILILAANLLLIWPKKGVQSAVISKKGIILRLIASITVASAFIIDAKISQNFSLNFYGFVLYLIPGIILLIYSRAPLKSIQQEVKQNLKGLVSVSVTGGLSYLVLLLSYPLASKSVILTLNNLSSVFMVILGIVFLREHHLLRRKILAIILAFLGAVIISTL